MATDETTWTVSREEAGTRLDKFLAAAGRLTSRGRAATALERGKVFVNEAEAVLKDASRRLERGDVVRVWMDRPGSAKPRPRERRVGDLHILYEDSELLVINKPAGLLTVPLEEREEETSVQDLLVGYFRSHGKRKPFVVHRIDRDTSGLVLFAKDAGSQHRLKEQFRRREPERVYWAVVYGHPDPPRGTWRDHLAWSPAARKQVETHARDRRASEAVSDYTIIERYRDTSLLEVRLRTGRRNQIRLQAGIHGHMLVGERKYGTAPEQARPIDFARQALHARRLAFRHPADDRPMAFEAPLPEDFSDLVGWLRRQR